MEMGKSFRQKGSHKEMSIESNMTVDLMMMYVAGYLSLQGMSEEEKIEQLELDIKCLQLLRGLIHNEIVKLPDDWELDPSSCKKLVICYAVCL